MYNPESTVMTEPQSQLRFWQELHSWREENSEKRYLETFKPTFIQSSVSESMNERIRAYLQTNVFLGGSIVICSCHLDHLLQDWYTDYMWESQITRQRTSRVWAEIMHNFARVLILDLYALPF